MGTRIRDRKFFTQPAEQLAKDLVGKIICHEVGNGNEKFIIKCRIRATEAYPNDDVTDANREKGLTSQLLQGGHLHFYSQKGEGRQRIDIVANEAGIAESVLIQAVDPYNDGPQIAVWALDITADEQLDGIDLLSADSKVWIERDDAVVELNEPKARKGLSDKAESKDGLLNFSVKKISFK